MQRRLGRRDFLRGTVGGAVFVGSGGILLAACGGDDDDDAATTTTAGESTGTTGGESAAADLGTATIQFDWIKNAEFAGVYIADKEGYFTDEGFSGVELLAGGPNVADMPVVVSNNALLGISVTEVTAGAILEGADITVVGALFQKNPFGIMSMADNPITSPQDMIGKTIGVQAVNDGLWDALLRINDIDPSEINKIVADFDPTPLVNGEADGWFSFITNEPNVLEAEGHEVATMALSDYGFSLYQQLLTTATSNMTENREAVVGAVRAIVKGWEHNSTDLEYGARLAVEEYGADLGLEMEASIAENEDQNELVVTETTTELGIGYMEESELEATLQTLADLGLDIPADVFTNEILDEIYADGPSLL
ncbi:MAG: ABC transporter substrate-binding protein [Actinomycetota bacterium]|nr:ABC transporter substrate-binding protein [Actinomycetota bacterium]